MIQIIFLPSLILVLLVKLSFVSFNGIKNKQTKWNAKYILNTDIKQVLGCSDLCYNRIEVEIYSSGGVELFLF